MVYTLKGRKVLVTGASRGLGAVIAEHFAKEGCAVALNYFSSPEKAQMLAKKIETEYEVKAIIVQGDMGKEAECTRTVQETISKLGGLDIIISNAGYTRFAKFEDIFSPTGEDWDTCFAVNVKAQTWLLKAAFETLTSNPEGGVFIMTSSMAGTKMSGSSMPYSVTKAAQLHLMKCLANTQGPKIRINAVLPGLLLTDWGLLYPAAMIERGKQMAKLNKVTDLDECAATYVDIAHNSSMTGQQIFVDAGLGIALP